MKIWPLPLEEGLKLWFSEMYIRKNCHKEESEWKPSSEERPGSQNDESGETRTGCDHETDTACWIN